MIPNSYRLEVGGRTYTVVDDLTTIYRLLVAGRVLSAPFGEPPASFEVDVDHPHVHVKLMGDGFFALAGDVPLLFPDLDTVAASLTLAISAPNHRPETITVSIPAGAAFPLPELTVSLPYRPLRVQGRVVMALDNSGVSGASVVSADETLLILRTPLHFDHNAGTNVQPVALGASGSVRTLADAAAAGSGALLLDDAGGLGGGAILRLGDEADYEFSVMDGPGAAAGEVLLRGGLYRSYPAGTAVQPVTATGAGATRALATDVAAGAGLLPLDGALVADAVAVLPADAVQNEFHALGARARADGYYRIDGVTGVATLTLFAASPAASHEAEREWTVRPEQPINVVHLRLTTP